MYSPHPWQNVDQNFEYVSITENSGASKSCNKIIDQYNMQDEIVGCNHTEMQLREISWKMNYLTDNFQLWPFI